MHIVAKVSCPWLTNPPDSRRVPRSRTAVWEYVKEHLDRRDTAVRENLALAPIPQPPQGFLRKLKPLQRPLSHPLLQPHGWQQGSHTHRHTLSQRSLRVRRRFGRGDTAGVTVALAAEEDGVGGEGDGASRAVKEATRDLTQTEKDAEIDKLVSTREL